MTRKVDAQVISWPTICEPERHSTALRTWSRSESAGGGAACVALSIGAGIWHRGVYHGVKSASATRFPAVFGRFAEVSKRFTPRRNKIAKRRLTESNTLHIWPLTAAVLPGFPRFLPLGRQHRSDSSPPATNRGA